MGQIIIGIMFMVIVISSLGLLYFYNKIANKKIVVENLLRTIYLQDKARIELIMKYAELSFNYGIRDKEIFNEFMKKQYNFTNAGTIEEAIKLSLEISHDLERLFENNGNQQWNLNKEFIELFIQLKTINVKTQEVYQIYDYEAMKYNNYLLKFPNNVFSSILGLKLVPYFLSN